jgi:hypothetical protein
VILLLGIYPKEHKSGYNRDTHTLMFIAALFTIAKPWKQTGALQLMNDQEIMVHMHNGVLLSHKE